VLVTADLATYFPLWLGRINFHDAVKSEKVQIDAIPTYTKAFSTWFAYSLAAPAVRAALPNPLLN
jgi:hypothetical protein